MSLTFYQRLLTKVRYSRRRGSGTDGVRPFEDIPGPRALPLIGSTWKYILPLPDKYDHERLHHAAGQKFTQYGPLVRETLPDGSGMVSVFDPEDVKSFLQQTMSHPDRRSHLALKKYRLDRPHMYSSGGLLPSNGEDWRRLRRASQGVFGRKEAVLGHLPDVDQVMRDFVQLLRRVRCPDHTVDDLLCRIQMLNLEVMGAVVLDHRLGGVTEQPPQQCRALMRAGGLSSQAILSTDNGPLQLYRLVATPLYRQLVRAQDLIYGVAKEHYDRKKRSLPPDYPTAGGNFDRHSKVSILEYLARTPALGDRDVVGILCDSLMAGVDTTSFSLAFALYHLSCNKEAQARLAEEATTLLAPAGGKVTAEVLSQARYTVAVVKESMRLNPISIGIGRVNTHKSIVIRNYHIPAGTTIVSMNQHIARNPSYFESPDEFRPERFLGDAKHHSHALLPFGQGSRMCIAQHVAKQTLYTALLHMCSQFSMSWRGAALGCKVRLINEPDGPLRVVLADRLPGA